MAFMVTGTAHRMTMDPPVSMGDPYRTIAGVAATVITQVTHRARDHWLVNALDRRRTGPAVWR